MCVFAIKPQPWMLDFPNVTRSRSKRCASAMRSRTPTPSSIIAAPPRDAASIAAAATAPVVRRASAAARSASHASGVNTRDSIGKDAPSATAGSQTAGTPFSPSIPESSSNSSPPNPRRANPPRLFPPRLRNLAPRTTYGTSSTNRRLPLTFGGPTAVSPERGPSPYVRLPIGSRRRYIASSSSSRPFFFIFFNLFRFGPKRASRRGARGAETATPKPVSHLPTGIVLWFSSKTRTEAFHFFAWPIPQCISQRLGSIVNTETSSLPSFASAQRGHKHSIKPVRG
mmetsp:Transcript_1272/g.5313  ORF Transcript_1272/g.5313 Transcript_1272/m.5313 type:complete len:284 (+) Transcript_1272:1137-1988(+)